MYKPFTQLVKVKGDIIQKIVFKHTHTSSKPSALLPFNMTDVPIVFGNKDFPRVGQATVTIPFIA